MLAARLALASATFLGLMTLASNDRWPEYRGPNADGTSGAQLPLHWSEQRNVRWKVPIHGRGWSSPVVFGNQVWLTTASPDGRELFVMCLERSTGRVLLDKLLFRVEKPRPLGNPVNSYATPSPVIEQGRVYVHFGSYGTASLSTDTFAVLWQRRDLPCDHWRGPASSPLLWNGLLFLHMDGANVQYVAALDAETGENRWITFRSIDYQDLGDDGRPVQGGDWRKAFNTPSIINHQGSVQLISPSAKGVYSYQPMTGREIWRVRHDGHSSAARSIFDGELLAINTGYVGSQAEIWGIRPDGSGDVTDTHVRWKYRRGAPRRSSPVLVDGKLYMVSDEGVVSCLDYSSGRELWKDRLSGSYSSSVLAAGGGIYFFNEEGAASVIEPGDRFRLLAVNHLQSGFMASPAVAGNSLFLRTTTHLYRIEE